VFTGIHPRLDFLNHMIAEELTESLDRFSKNITGFAIASMI